MIELPDGSGYGSGHGNGYGYGYGYGYAPRSSKPNPLKQFETQYPKLKQLRERAEAGLRWLDQRR